MNLLYTFMHFIFDLLIDIYIDKSDIFLHINKTIVDNLCKCIHLKKCLQFNQLLQKNNLDFCRKLR